MKQEVDDDNVESNTLSTDFDMRNSQVDTCCSYTPSTIPQDLQLSGSITLTNPFSALADDSTSSECQTVAGSSKIGVSVLDNSEGETSVISSLSTKGGLSHDETSSLKKK